MVVAQAIRMHGNNRAACTVMGFAGLKPYDCSAIAVMIGRPGDTEGMNIASITIRNLDDEVKTRLRMRAAEHHRSMEEEARLILREAVGRKPSSRNLAEIARSYFGPDNGVDLELPPRGPGREPPSFD